MQDAEEEAPVASTSTRASRGSTAASSSRARPVGGLLGDSEYAKRPAATAGTSKLKFVPNMKRKTKVVHDDEDE